MTRKSYHPVEYTSDIRKEWCLIENHEYNIRFLDVMKYKNSLKPSNGFRWPETCFPAIVMSFRVFITRLRNHP